jgi:hypothetical protein
VKSWLAVLLVVLFFVSGLYMIVGNVFMYFLLRARGIRSSMFLGTTPLYPPAIYFRRGGDLSSQRTDRFALSAMLAILPFAIVALLLFGTPYFLN